MPCLRRRIADRLVRGRAEPAVCALRRSRRLGEPAGEEHDGLRARERHELHLHRRGDESGRPRERRRLFARRSSCVSRRLRSLVCADRPLGVAREQRDRRSVPSELLPSPGTERVGHTRGLPTNPETTEGDSNDRTAAVRRNRPAPAPQRVRSQSRSARLRREKRSVSSCQGVVSRVTTDADSPAPDPKNSLSAGAKCFRAHPVEVHERQLPSDAHGHKSATGPHLNIER